MLYILTFQVLSLFSAKFLFLSRFLNLGGQIPGYFWTWTDKQREWEGWVHKPGLTHLSLVCSPELSVWHCVCTINSCSTLLN